MRLNWLIFHPASALLLAVCAISAATPSQADTIAWAKWSSATAGNPGTASATIGSLSVTYSGQNSGLLMNFPSWTPTSTFTGGVVGNPPPAANNSVQLEGTPPGAVPISETITFSSPVVDPIFAVWSLGAPGRPASFDFNSSEPFTVQGGGPSAEFGGTALFISGEDVEGEEGNGIIQFNGTFSSITFTTPQFESYYAFTVGEDATLTGQPPGGTTPEPGTLSLFGLGLAALPFVRRSLSRLRP